MIDSKQALEDLNREAWDDQMRQDALEAQIAQDEELDRIYGRGEEDAG